MADSNRQDFLSKVRRSLGRPGMTPPPDKERFFGSEDRLKPAHQLRQELDALVHEQRESLIESLDREFTRVQGQVARIGSELELQSYVRDLVSSQDIKRVARWDTPLPESLDETLTDSGAAVTTIGPEDGDAGEAREALVNADLGITEVDFALADTGSLVLLSKHDQSRLVSLLPPIHLAMVRPGDIVPSMANILPLLPTDDGDNPGRMPSSVTFITGPSRTADIEKILTIGIHGPTAAHLLILDYL